MKQSMQWARRHLGSQRQGELSCNFTQEDSTQSYFPCTANRDRSYFRDSVSSGHLGRRQAIDTFLVLSVSDL